MAISIQLRAPAAYGLELPDGYTHKAGQDIADTAYHLAHAYPGGVPALALRMGVSASTLKHKLNPANTTHHLTLRESMALQTLTGSAAILHAMAEELGYTCTLAMTDTADGDPLRSVVELSSAVADFMRAVSDPLDRGNAAPDSISKNEMRRAQAMAEEAIAAINHTLAMLRARLRQPPPEPK